MKITARLRGRSIYVAGNDGTGKTTQARLVIEDLRGRGITCRYVWLRFPQLASIPILALSRVLGVTRYETVEGVRRGRWEFYRARWLAWALLWCQVVDAAAYRAFRLCPALLRGEVVVLDRFVYDIAVDIAAAAGDRRFLCALPARLLYRLAPPGPAIILHADVELLRQRRVDLAGDELLLTRAGLYQRLAKEHRITAIDADQQPAEIHAQVMRLLEDS